MTITTIPILLLYPDKRKFIQVLNRYACPYDNKDGKIKADVNFDVGGIFALSKLAFQVELAFATAHSMSQSNKTIYEADFEMSKVKKFMQIIMVILIHFQQNNH